mmetsp:Transcript_26027/g.60771  ORF Transcript_26027/g.60771 Transcript_26027/m.60771 type:complete len:211 (-) Transcript_26027:57-689(-)
MCSREAHDLFVVEAHPVEDVTQVLRTLRGVGQAVVGREALVFWVAGRRRRCRRVGPAWKEANLRTAHLLDGNAAGVHDEVGEGDLRLRRPDRLEQLHRVHDASVPAMVALRREAYGASIRAAIAALLVICACRMPRETHKEWTDVAAAAARAIGSIDRRVERLLVVDQVHELLLHLVPVRTGGFLALGERVTGSERGADARSGKTTDSEH